MGHGVIVDHLVVTLGSKRYEAKQREKLRWGSAHLNQQKCIFLCSRSLNLSINGTLLLTKERNTIVLNRTMSEN